MAVAAAAAKTSEDFIAEVHAIEGIGEVIATNVDAFLRDPHVGAVLDKLYARGVDPEEPITAVTNGVFTGKTLVVTGTLTQPRADVQKRIEAAGGKVAGSVSKKTSYLVAGADTGVRFITSVASPDSGIPRSRPRLMSPSVTMPSRRFAPSSTNATWMLPLSIAAIASPTVACVPTMALRQDFIAIYPAFASY